MNFRYAKHETVWILLTEGRVSERRLRYEFELDPDQIDTLRHELIDIKGWAVAEPNGVWIQLLSAPFGLCDKTKVNWYISFVYPHAPRRGAYEGVYSVDPPPKI